MQQMAWLFFVLFAVILAGMYLSIRRQWLAPGLTAALGVIASIVLMTLTSLGQGNMPVQAVIVGILLGGLFSGATLAIAWYFQRAEVQKRYSSGVHDETVVEQS
jgi:peptidoglycan biosynthesis protein MviN/MurJ (putative lipid II flippase)